MAKVSQIDKAIAALKAERDILDLAIAKLEAQQALKITSSIHRPLTRKPRKSRRHANSEGATTDSGNMNYPPA